MYVQIVYEIFMPSFLCQGWFAQKDFFYKLGFTPCKAEQPLWGMELQEIEARKDQSTQEICLERTYS